MVKASTLNRESFYERFMALFPLRLRETGIYDPTLKIKGLKGNISVYFIATESTGFFQHWYIIKRALII